MSSLPTATAATISPTSPVSGLACERVTISLIGNRFRGHIASGAMPKLNRYLGNPILSALGRTLTHTNLGDFHSGMRGFRAAAIATLDLRTDGMEYASEMISRAGRARPPN